jgi:RNA polymerase sigma factor for flagellar operon FliA
MTTLELHQWQLLRNPDSTPEERERTRQDLLGQYLPLVRMVVSRLALNFPSATVENADLIQSGVLGLMEAVERFDPAMGVEFRTYAQARIRGSILDELRSLDWAPRSVREKTRQLNRATEALNNQLKRPPTSEETAAALGMTREAYQRLSEEAQTRSLRSLEALMETEGESASWPRRDADLDADQLQQELVTVLKDGVGKLGDRERLLLKRYYENNKTLKEIAEELGITESRVCQIHGALLIKLKVWFEGRLQEQPTASMLYHKLVRS